MIGDDDVRLDHTRSILGAMGATVDDCEELHSPSSSSVNMVMSPGAKPERATKAQHIWLE